MALAPGGPADIRQAAFQMVALYERETGELKAEISRLRAVLSSHGIEEADHILRATASVRSVGSTGPPPPLPAVPDPQNPNSSGNYMVSLEKARSDNPQTGKEDYSPLFCEGLNGISDKEEGLEQQRQASTGSKVKSVDDWLANNLKDMGKEAPPKPKPKAEAKGGMVLEEQEVKDLVKLNQVAKKKTMGWSEWVMDRVMSTFTSRVQDIDAEDAPSPLQATQKMVKRIITTPLFDLLIGIIIVTHSVCIGIETAEAVTHNRHHDWIRDLDTIFLAVYILELGLRFFATGPRKALESNWVKFDALMVATGVINLTLVSVAGEVEGLDDIMLVRILRISRLARAARLMIQFRTLWMLVQGLMHSILTLLWVILIVWVICYIFAILGMELFKDAREVDAHLKFSSEYIEIAQANFGTMIDAMLTMFQLLTLDSVAALYRPLIRQKPFLSLYFMAYLLLVPIALMNLVTAIMVESALKQASEDQEAQRAWDKQKRKTLLPKLARLFKDLDADGSGELDLEELRGANETVQEQLMAICNWGEVEDIFNQLDYDSSGSVGIDEFCEGLLKAGTDKPVELYCIMRQCCDILANSRQAVSMLEDLPKGRSALVRKSTQSTIDSVNGVKA